MLTATALGDEGDPHCVWRFTPDLTAGGTVASQIKAGDDGLTLSGAVTLPKAQVFDLKTKRAPASPAGVWLKQTIPKGSSKCPRSAATLAAEHVATPPQAVQLNNPLKKLPALPKIHHSWPFPARAGLCTGRDPEPAGCVQYLNDSSPAYLDGFLHDYVRITGSCPLDLTQATATEAATCAALCAASAKEPAKCIAVNYSPWYAKFPSSDPTIVGPPEDAEMAYYTGLLANVTRWLAASEHGGSIAAVRKAHQRHGGEGALYIVLKRSS